MHIKSHHRGTETILGKTILMKILAICSLETLWHPAFWHVGSNLLQYSPDGAGTYRVLSVSPRIWSKSLMHQILLIAIVILMG